VERLRGAEGWGGFCEEEVGEELLLFYQPMIKK